MLDLVENVTVALITSDLGWPAAFRVPVQPTLENGLRKPSEVMIDLLVTVPLGRVRSYVGTIESEVMRRVDTALRLFLGL